MKRLTFLILTFISINVFSQEQIVNQLKFVKADGSHNSDETLIYRDDKVGDRTRLVIKMGDEYTSDLEVGYRFYIDDKWYKTFSLDGYGNGYFKSSLAIGTENTNGSKLTVKGLITATEIKVEAQTADFVFEEDYILRPLDEVEAFVKTNKHLPEIPSAKQMEADGVNVAEMNKLLLQKVEELTLYTIQQKNVIESQWGKLNIQESKLNNFSERLKQLELLLIKNQ